MAFEESVRKLLEKDAEVFDKAADQIMVRGGTERDLVDPETGSVCLVGAIGLGLGMSQEELLEHEEQGLDERQILGNLHTVSNAELQKLTYVFPWYWNDGFRQVDKDLSAIVVGDPPSDDERIEVLRKTAKILRERAQTEE